METNIRKWGNSAGIIIPQGLLKDCNLAIGDTVDLSIDNGAIVIRSINTKTDIKALFAEIVNLTKDLPVNEKKKLFSKLESESQ